MSIVVDYSASRISPAALKAAGVVGVCRYLSAPGLSKVIHKPEYDELRAAGIDVTLNWEQFATDWLGGASAGAAHAASAVAQANALNYQNTSPHKVIPGSADFNMTRAQWLSSGRAYAIAYAAGIRAGGYRPGVYGPYNVLQWVKEEGIMDAFWQAGMSWSWPNNDARPPKLPWPGAHLVQRRHITIGGVDTDLNDILVTPLWGAKTVGKKDDMPLNMAAVFTPASAGVPARTSWYIGNTIEYTMIVTWDEHNQRLAEGAVEKKFNSTDDWLAHTGRIMASNADIDASELAAISKAAMAGAGAALTASLPTLVDLLLSKLPANTLTRDQLVAVVDEGVRGVFADAATPIKAPPAA